MMTSLLMEQENNLTKIGNNTIEGENTKKEDKEDKITRMSLDLNSEMTLVIEQLAKKSGRTKAEVVRQSIALYKTIKEAEANGEYPALINKAGQVTAKLIGI